MRVRDAQAADAAEIARVHVQAWQQGYAQLMPPSFLGSLSLSERALVWQRRLSGSESCVLICEVGDAVAGWISAGTSRDEDAGPEVAEIHALNVDPALWAKGCGKRLCAEAGQRMARAGFRMLTLWVLAGNERGRRFYERIGFALDAGVQKQFHHESFSLPELRYRKPL